MEAFGGSSDGAREPDKMAPISKALGSRSIVLVGMMGAGKSSVGKRLSQRLGLPFFDADTEIERAAAMTIPEIFEKRGEAEFRQGEQRVIARLLGDGPMILATGGGAYMNDATRQLIGEQGISIWLKADFDVLMRRVRKRSNRPLLQNPDPEGTLKGLMDLRYPVYALTDLHIQSRDVAHDVIVDEIIAAISRHLGIGVPLVTTKPLSQAHVRVDLPGRAYDIAIGSNLLEEAGERIAALAPGAACAIVTDETVAGIHLPVLEDSLKAAGIRTAAIRVPSGERSKSMTELDRVVDGILSAKMERGDLVVALGGGVVGDLAGFAAAITRRGMRFVQIPTTLLAQVDSSVGGKTGVNSSHGKNLIGAFHQPSLVLADVDVLDTLSKREFAAGYAEVVKYGLINDADFFTWCETHAAKILAREPQALVEAIEHSVRAKAKIVAADERETEDHRALLNLGHTFGHALEAETGFSDVLLHGEGVAAGMALAHAYSARIGHLAADEAQRVTDHLASIGLPVSAQDAHVQASGQRLVEHMLHDKKMSGGKLPFILSKGIGRAYVDHKVEIDDVAAFLDGTAR